MKHRWRKQLKYSTIDNYDDELEVDTNEKESIKTKISTITAEKEARQKTSPGRRGCPGPG